MSALTAQRDTQRKLSASDMKFSYPVKGSTTIYKGSLVVLNAGYAAPGSTATGLIAAGRAMATVVNAGSDGAATIEVEEGVFLWVTADITQAEVGAVAYVTDDQTVTKTSSGASKAGTTVGIETATAVWVRTVLGDVA